MIKQANFMESAKSLSRNPLGIIALFIMLVYAIASAVVALAKPEFYEHGYHPAILFLCIFPVFVLIAFTYLVAKYHRNLYAPADYINQSDFLFGVKIPAALSANRNVVTTSDRDNQTTESAVIGQIDNAYKNWVSFGFCVLHRSEVIRERTSPKSGRYYTRIWVEPIDSHHSLKEIASVTYHVWGDFQEPIRSTTAIEANFDLWISIYGEFPVVAVIQTKSGKTFELQRYIDLPGRPPD